MAVDLLATLSQEIPLSEALDTAAENLLALYGVTPLRAYADGRIKIRTATGAYLDMPRGRDYETRNWLLDAAHLRVAIHVADRLYEVEAQNRRGRRKWADHA